MTHLTTIKPRKNTDIPISKELSKQKGRSKNTTIIFIPGLLETADTPLFVHTIDILSKQKDFETICMSGTHFYGYGKNVTLESTSISAQVQDVTKKISELKKKSNRIVLVGHSLGAFVSLLVKNVKIDRVIMWDPSLHPQQIFASTTCSVSTNKYYDPHIKQTISAQLMKELPLLLDIPTMTKSATCPIGIISAEKGALRVVAPYAQHMRISLGHMVIKGADHNFSTFQNVTKLVDYTVQLIKKRPPRERRPV